jgi:hypothetical protein
MWRLLHSEYAANILQPATGEGKAKKYQLFTIVPLFQETQQNNLPFSSLFFPELAKVLLFKCQYFTNVPYTHLSKKISNDIQL